MVHDAEGRTRQHARIAHTPLGSHCQHGAFHEENEVAPSARKNDEDEFNCKKHDIQSGPPTSDGAHTICRDMDNETDKNSVVANALPDAEWCSSSIQGTQFEANFST